MHASSPEAEKPSRAKEITVLCLRIAPEERTEAGRLLRDLPLGSGLLLVALAEGADDAAVDLRARMPRAASPRVRVAAAGEELAEGVIHVVPAGTRLTVSQGCFVAAEDEGRNGSGAGRGWSRLLTSLAAEAGPRVALVSSGAPDEELSVGLAALRAAGGLVLGAGPGMPGLSTTILAWKQSLKSPEDGMRDADLGMNGEADADADDGEDTAPELAGVLARLRREHGLDFAQYKIPMVRRRVERRIVAGKFGSAADYTRELDARPEELDALYRDLLIGVTSFFRDPEVFDTLGARVYSPMLERKGPGEELRVWVAGCASGHEAYSHAILIDEIARKLPRPPRVLIFATDVHRASLEEAAAGVFEAADLAPLGPERIARHFHEESDGRHRVTPELRARVVFAPHNLLCDPPFVKLDVVSCRNLLIYLRPPAQERALALFHYGLRRDGVLLLGQSEGLGRLAGEFETIDAKAKLHRKVRDLRLPADRRAPRSAFASPAQRGEFAATPAPAPLPRGLLQAYGQLLADHLPPGFIVTPDGEILHYIGDGALYLPPVAGRVQENLLARADGDLRLALSLLLPRALRERAPVESRGLRVRRQGVDTPELADLLVRPLIADRPENSPLHVSLRSPRPIIASPSTNDTVQIDFLDHDTVHRRLADLELELNSANERLQATVEALQAANEELQSTNEEMLAANEELQAANEELHSLNEELRTVNDELERKNNELTRINADHDSLLGAIDAGTLFLDERLRIRKYNAAIEDVFRLLPQDLGRPIEHIAYRLQDQAVMLADARAVLANGQPREREVRSQDGRWFLKRVLPYRLDSSGPAGVVLTFTRIDLIKSIQAKLHLAMAASRLVWWEWDLPTGRLLTHSEGPCILGHDGVNLPRTGEGWMGLVHPDDLARVRAGIDACLEGRASAWDCEHRYLDAGGAWRWVREQGRVTERDTEGRPLRLLGTTQDIDARRVVEAELAKLSQAILQVEVSVLITDLKGNIEYVNPHFTRVTGYEPSEVLGRNIRLLKSEATPAAVYSELWKTISGGEPWRGELVSRRKSGAPLYERMSISPVKDAAGRISHYVGIKEDITAQRAEGERRSRLEHQLAQSQKMETLGTLAGGIAHDFNNLLTAILGHADLWRHTLPEDHAAQESIRQVEHAGRRATDLVRRILAFSRHQPPGRKVFAPSRLLAEAVPMLRASLPTTLELRHADRSEGRTVLGDETQLEQVLLNLCTNSAQAIGPRPGRIEITLEHIVLDSAPVMRVGEITAGPCLRLTVADDGPGMAPEVLDRIFEPFFTTKAPGEGTGLGLAIVHNIVLSHRGALGVESAPGRGTAFTIFLPEAEELPLAPEAAPGPEPGPATAPDGRRLRVAVVDDEPGIVLLNTISLEQAGYAPVAFDSAEACLGALRESPDAADILLTDQTMPGMTGVELIQTLRSEGQQIPVVLVSGYSRVVDEDLLARLGRVRFLAKPFELADLLREIRILSGTS